MIEERKDKWSSQGRRVILLARKVVSKEQSRFTDVETEVLDRCKTGLTLVGLVGIVDPPRNEIPQVVRTLRRAGIRIFMVSTSLTNLAGPRALTIDRSRVILHSQLKRSPRNAASSATHRAKSEISKHCLVTMSDSNRPSVWRALIQTRESTHIPQS